MATTIAFDEVLELVNQLSADDRARLIAHLLQTQHRPRRSSYGALADIGPAPSAEDIDEMRREVWGNFPSDDI